MTTLSEKYQYVVAFIAFGKYGAALDVLKTIDEPRARELEAEIERIAGDERPTLLKPPAGWKPPKPTSD
ncbi:MAG TPA: hypothetical protein VHL11_23060 [Phototrophicaceae bacterium]|nr:hypothetical protein [Phototrophicaceae bacterium]